MITACVIVKNEERNLPRWLLCVEKLAEEIIVVDTGSTDKTVEIAKKAGADVFSFEWCDDFSRAKNYALRKAHGDWIVFLDADEYFPPEDIPKVKSYIDRMDPQAMGIVCPWINIDVDKDGSFIDEGLQIRIFRNDKELRYYGKVHEALMTHGNNKVVQLPDIHIIHTGYSSSIVKSKCQRNLDLLLVGIDTRGLTAQDCFYLADCYYGLEDYGRAKFYAHKAVVSGLTLIGLENRPQDILRQIETMEKMQGKTWVPRP